MKEGGREMKEGNEGGGEGKEGGREGRREGGETLLPKNCEPFFKPYCIM